MMCQSLLELLHLTQQPQQPILLMDYFHFSGGFRNSERGVQPLAREARPQIFGLPRPLSVTLEVQTEYLEATLGLVKCLEISKELIRV